MAHRRRRMPTALGLAVVAFALAFTPGAGLSSEMSSPTHRLIGGSFSAGAASDLEIASGAPGVGGGSAVIGEAGPAGAIGTPDGVTLAAGFSAHAAQAVVCGNGTLDPGEACDDGGTIPGDGCWATCESENTLAFLGTAVGGFTIEFTVNGVMLILFTQPAETATDIAERVAARISSLQDGDALDALAVGNQVFTSATLTNTVSNDPGISLGGAPPVPSLPRWGLVLLTSLLFWCGWVSVTRRGAALVHE